MFSYQFGKKSDPSDVLKEEIKQSIFYFYTIHRCKHTKRVAKELKKDWYACFDNKKLSDKNRLAIFNDICIATLEQLKTDLKVAEKKILPLQVANQIYSYAYREFKEAKTKNNSHEARKQAVAALQKCERLEQRVGDDEIQKIEELQKSIFFVQGVHENVLHKIREISNKKPNFFARNLRKKDALTGALLGGLVAGGLATASTMGVVWLVALCVGSVIAFSLLALPVGALIRGCCRSNVPEQPPPMPRAPCVTQEASLTQTFKPLVLPKVDNSSLSAGPLKKSHSDGRIYSRVCRHSLRFLARNHSARVKESKTKKQDGPGASCLRHSTSQSGITS